MSNTETLDKAVQEYKQDQQEALIIDFDEAVAEERANAIIVKFDGQEFELPPKAPAWLPLFINRHGQGKDNELSDKHNLEMIERLLGKEFASKIVNEDHNFVSFESVNDKILQPVMQHWGFSEAGNVKKPKKTPAS